ncbi:MAG TPA: hypothetical protein VK446_08780 [Methylocystis sp.]|nr:hypothetical protein [Methylocystis sp.]
MRSLFLSMFFLLAATCVQAVEPIRYVQVNIDETSSRMPSLSSKSIVMVGNVASIIRTPMDASQQSVRLDYAIRGFGLTEDGQPTATIDGTLYVGQRETWTIVSEFDMIVKIDGGPATMEVERGSGAGVALTVGVQPMTERAFLDRFGGKIPQGSVSDGSSAE